MTTEEILEMAKQVGFEEHQAKFDTRFEPFAKLVAGREREACAKVCEEQYEYYGHDHVFAKAIRARGQE
jgi:hypothetical protein